MFVGERWGRTPVSGRIDLINYCFEPKTGFMLGEDYVRTARAKGLPAWRIVGVHAMRNALLPVITVIGKQVGALLAGAVLTETIFSWPGIGKWLIESINRRDYPALQGGIMLISAMAIVVDLIVDVLYGVVNPRIRHA